MICSQDAAHLLLAIFTGWLSRLHFFFPQRSRRLRRRLLGKCCECRPGASAARGTDEANAAAVLLSTELFVVALSRPCVASFAPVAPWLRLEPCNARSILLDAAKPTLTSPRILTLVPPVWSFNALPPSSAKSETSSARRRFGCSMDIARVFALCSLGYMTKISGGIIQFKKILNTRRGSGSRSMPPLVHPNPSSSLVYKTCPQRWYILTVFSLFSFNQCLVIVCKQL